MIAVRLASAASVFLLVACEDPNRFIFHPAATAAQSVAGACSADPVDSILASDVFSREQTLCISDTDWNTMSVADVVTRQRDVRPSLETRVQLFWQGTMDRYDTVAWGLDSNGDVTFLTRESYLPVGNARVHARSGWGGCVPTEMVEIDQMATEQEGCVLRLRIRADQP